jgi:hypothetical protein
MKHMVLIAAAIGILAVMSSALAGERPADAPGTLAASGQAKIFGHVRDFKGQPIPGADVELKDARFENMAVTRSAEDGSYSLAVKAGMYMALAAVKNYRLSSLEYWAWNVPAFGDLEINPRFDRLEVYAINAWRPQGACPSYQIYFRPMSLLKTGAAVMKAGGMQGLAKVRLFDIAPELEAKDIEVRVQGEAVDVLRVNKVKEASSSTQDLYAYLIQVSLPKSPAAGDWVAIDITITDPATHEKGEGRLYLARSRQPS